MLSRLGVPGLCGITMGLALGILNQSGTTAQAFDPAAVQCYPATSRAATQTRAVAHEDHNAVVQSAREALAAVQACAPAACSRAQTSRMEHALTSYLALRREITSGHYHQQGTRGLDTAAKLFAASDDVRLSQSLAQLYAAGRLDFKALSAEREALALAALKPAEAFRPCEATAPAAPVRGYVF